MSKMPDNFIDLVVTSPPYDALRTYSDGCEKLAWNFKIFTQIASELYRVMKEGGVVVWVVGDQTIKGDETGTSFRQALFFKEIGFLLHDTMIYHKTGGSMPTPKRYLACFEYMFVFSKCKPPTTYNLLNDRENRWKNRWGKDGGKRIANGEIRSKTPYKIEPFGRRFNVWQYHGGYGYGTKDNVAYQHPAIFPEHLAGDHILSWSNEGDCVYDPFMGSGTTAKMALIYRRKFIGSEINAVYCQLAEKRLAEYRNLLF